MNTGLSHWWAFQKVNPEEEEVSGVCACVCVRARVRVSSGFADTMPASAQRCSLQLTTVER